MKFNQIGLVVLLLVVISCYPPSETETISNIDESKFNFEIEIKDKEKLFSWDGHVDSVEFVPLETTLEGLIGRVTKAEVHDRNLYILDIIHRKLAVFDTNTGKFMSTIGKKGKGPGEYLDIKDFNIVNDTIYSLDHLRVNKYASQGHAYVGTTYFKSNEIREINPMHCLYYGDDLFYIWNNIDKGTHNLKSDDQFLKLYNGEHNIANYFAHEGLRTFDENRFFRTYNAEYLVTPPIDEFYISRINRDTVENYIKLNFGKEGIPKEYLNSIANEDDYNNLLINNNYYKIISNLVKINNGLIYFECLGPGSFSYEGLLNLKDHTVKFGKKDFRFSPNIMYADEDFLYAYYDPVRLKALEGHNMSNVNNEIFNKLEERLTTFKEDDNIILVKFTIK